MLRSRFTPPTLSILSTRQFKHKKPTGLNLFGLMQYKPSTVHYLNRFANLSCTFTLLPLVFPESAGPSLSSCSLCSTFNSTQCISHRPSKLFHILSNYDKMLIYCHRWCDHLVINSKLVNRTQLLSQSSWVWIVRSQVSSNQYSIHQIAVYFR